MNGARASRAIRIRSSRQIFGMPLYDIALGPDFNTNQPRGVARGFFAVGDVAIGVFAAGGVAIGGVTVGGVTIG